MLVSYWLFKAYSLKTEAIEGTVTCTFKSESKRKAYRWKYHTIMMSLCPTSHLIKKCGLFTHPGCSFASLFLIKKFMIHEYSLSLSQVDGGKVCPSRKKCLYGPRDHDSCGTINDMNQKRPLFSFSQMHRRKYHYVSSLYLHLYGGGLKGV